ncbi:hypothetical protein THAOC_18014 [Thalassiosira oceanica]|uniref:Uncharacterized protein n=1 Tax=Thalassiosira oceanica TaxID=159749 RepID=K0S861_THAOC|nr:hypothetical protein THAOC_18014 [Thalassiosira oceanica]|eukprot:EJK61490.1 hypothetical protein THAOC_18014 [Thalassiosira oceanica]
MPGRHDPCPWVERKIDASGKILMVGEKSPSSDEMSWPGRDIPSDLSSTWQSQAIGRILGRADPFELRAFMYAAATSSISGVDTDKIRQVSGHRFTGLLAANEPFWDHLTMANIGRRCTMEIAEECILKQNRPLIPILASVKAVNDFGLEVESRPTPRNYTANGTPPFET